jgi:hypothetical protein
MLFDGNDDIIDGRFQIVFTGSLIRGRSRCDMQRHLEFALGRV